MSQDFAAACQVYYDRVYRFLLALSGDPNQAEDLTQEVFYRALLHIGSYREQGQMLTWLCAIGKNLWLSQCRKERRRTPTLADTPQPGPEEPEKKHEKTFRKGMKKIRRRWIASLIVVIILVPFVLMGIAQVTGDGLCYTNLHEFYLAHAFLGKMKAGDYEGAAKYVDRETRRGEFQERFTEEELANYDQDAIDTFVAAAQGYTEMGGLSGYRFHWGGYASAVVGGESFDGDTFYRFDFTITVGGKDYLASLEVTDNGVTNCSVYDNPMGGPQQLNAINVWEYTLWDEYEARYDNPEREAAYTAFVEQRAYESGLQVAPKE